MHRDASPYMGVDIVNLSLIVNFKPYEVYIYIVI